MCRELTGRITLHQATIADLHHSIVLNDQAPISPAAIPAQPDSLACSTSGAKWTTEESSCLAALTRSLGSWDAIARTHSALVGTARTGKDCQAQWFESEGRAVAARARLSPCEAGTVAVERARRPE